MKEKKTPSKRTNGAAKVKTAAKPRTRKLNLVPSGEGMTSVLTDDEIACRAYALWEVRGRPYGSPDVDWYKAKEQLLESAR